VPKYFTITILVILFVGLILPQVVLAGRFPFEGPLVPCGTEANPEKCGICHFFKLAQNIIDLFITLIVFIAPLMIVIGGVILLTSSGIPEKAGYGKRIITYTVIGMVIAFTAWVVINTIMLRLANPEVVPMPWNEIKCGPTEPIGETHETHKECVDSVCKNVAGAGEDKCQTDADCEETFPKDEKKYCICETPVYATIERNIQLFTEIQGTDLNDKDNCETNCKTVNAETYCPDRKTAINPHLYCASQNELEAKRAFCYKQEAITDSITGACFTNSNECYDSIHSNPDYTKKCYYDDYLYCKCTEGSASWCSQSKPSGLYRTSKDVGVGGLFDAWACTRNCKYSQGYCRLTAAEEEEEVTWRFQSGVQYQEEQKADATTALKNFLDCFYEKAPDNIGYISTITDKDIYNGTCNPQNCKKDTCTLDDCGPGNPCDHSCHSCHYGGTCNTTKSYAVDFGDEGNVCQLADTALKCGSVNKIFGPQSCGGKVTVDGKHNDHVHISVINSCNCN